MRRALMEARFRSRTVRSSVSIAPRAKVGAASTAWPIPRTGSPSKRLPLMVACLECNLNEGMTPRTQRADQPWNVRSPDRLSMLGLITHYGLALIFANVLIQQIGLPIPALPTLIVAGALAAD